jgi:hypothetical protein
LAINVNRTSEQLGQLYTDLNAEKERSEALLLNTLPRAIVDRLHGGETVIADRIPAATILFSDLVDFTALAARLPPERMIELLGRLRRCRVRRRKRGDAEVHRSGRSGDAVDRGASRTGVFRLFGQLSDRCRHHEHRRCRGDDGNPASRVTAAKRMIERSLECFDFYPTKLIGDTGYGSAEMLDWLVHEQGIEPHIPVFDNSQHTDGTFSRDDFAYGHKRDCYVCPAGKELRQRQKIYRMPRPLVDENGLMRYRASKLDCEGCSLKPRCCPNAPARKILRSIHEGARDMARDIAATDAYVTSRRERKKVEMLFAHLILAPETNYTSPPPRKTSASSPC